MTRPADLIFVSLEDWDDVWRRNQFLCGELARRHPAVRILFVGLPRDVSHGLRRGKLGVLREAATAAVPGLNNVTVVKPLKLLPDSLPPGRAVNRWLFRRAVRRASRQMVGPTLWLNPYTAGHLIGRVGERRVVYDITDDWELADVSPRRRAMIHRQDRDLCRRADLTIVCSQALADSRRPVSRRLLLLPNGVDVEHYLAVSTDVRTTDGRPVFGYTGTLHPDRIDLDLVLAVAAAFPTGTVYLIGPNVLGETPTQRLASAGNIRVTGPMRYADLPAVMANFDVCIVPHRRTPFTESLNPIKLWEYLAAGKPVVTTPVAGFRDYPDLCRLAGTTAEFIAACREAATEGNARTADRRAEAAKHTWASRVDRLETELAAVAHFDPADEPTGWSARRIAAAAFRRLRLAWARVRHTPVRFGRRCNVRGGFRSLVGPRGSASFAPGCVVDRNFTLEALGSLSVGPRTIFGHGCTLAARQSIRIGADCMFAEMVSVRDHDHASLTTDKPYRDQGFTVRPVTIGNNVWLGGKVSVLKGVTIGDNTVVGAHAVVTKDLPPNVIAVGVPARVVRQL